MMSDIKELISVIDDLNYTMWGDGNLPATESQFCLHYYTYDVCILFDDIVLWNSTDDLRKFNEETNEYEDMKEFLKKQFNKYVLEFVENKKRLSK